MQSKAKTVKQYLAELPSDRRAAVQAVRDVILKNLGEGYEEGMSYGMIGYYVPHELYPAGYHCDPKLPLCFGGLASQKNHLSVYFMSLYASGPEEKWFRSAWEKTGKKLDMGKCCIRFKKVDDLALDVLGEAIRRMPVKKWIAFYDEARANQWGKKGKTPATKSTKRATAAKTAGRKAPAKKAAAAKARTAAARG